MVGRAGAGAGAGAGAVLVLDRRIVGVLVLVLDRGFPLNAIWGLCWHTVFDRGRRPVEEGGSS